MVQINLSSQDVTDSKKSGFDPIPAGEYNATIYEIDEGAYSQKSKNPGAPNVNIQFKITGPAFANRRLFQTVGLFPKWSSGSNNFLFWQLLKALDVDYTPGEAFDFDPSEYLGTEVNLTVQIEDDTYKFEQALKEWESEDEAKRGDAPVQDKFKRNNIRAIKEFEEIDSEEDDDEDDGFDIG